jgi:hypothetical protein
LVEIINEFIVKEDARGHFELAYGPGGAWSNLFGRSSGFRGTTVLCDTENPRRYLIIDLWDTVEQIKHSRSVNLTILMYKTPSMNGLSLRLIWVSSVCGRKRRCAPAAEQGKGNLEPHGAAATGRLSKTEC